MNRGDEKKVSSDQAKRTGNKSQLHRQERGFPTVRIARSGGKEERKKSASPTYS